VIQHILIVLAATVPLASAHAESLQVAVDGVRSADGEIQLDLYLAGRIRAGRLRVPATTGSTTALFTGVAPGAYAVEVYHDENANQRLDTGGLLGLPVEGYGFSNNARIRMGPPSFEAMRIDVRAGAKLSTRISLRYPRAAR
jgi:uncharacterized protein (DUF2141 family)